MISRDIFILLGSSVIYLLKGSLKIEPNISGKATTFFQILSIIVILTANIIFVPQEIINFVIHITTVLTIISALTYLQQGLKQI